MIFRGRRIHKQWCEYDEESVHYIKMQDRKDIIIRAGFNLRDVRHWEEYDNSDNYYKNNDPSTVIFFEGGFNMVILVSLIYLIVLWKTLIRSVLIFYSISYDV